MVVNLQRTPRGDVIDRINHVISPLAQGTLGITGPLNAVDFTGSVTSYDYATPYLGTVAGKLTNNSGNAGTRLMSRTLSELQIGVGYQYTFSIYLRSPSGAANPTLHIVGPGFDYVLPAVATKGAWYRASKTFTATADGSMQVYLNFDANQAGATCLFDAMQIDVGAAPLDFIWGSRDPAGATKFKWLGDLGFSLSAAYHLDAATLFSPQLVLGYDVQQDSRNIVHQLADGPVAATTLQAAPRKGVLKLFFPDALSAESARQVLAGVGYWDFIDTGQTQEAMAFVVNGTVRKYQDGEQRIRWIVEVPYQAVA